MKKVIQNYLYTFGYQVLLMILPVITLPYVSRVLLPKGVGINSWTYSISSYFILFAVLGLTTYGQREVALCREDEERLNITFWEIEFASVITTSVSLLAYSLTAFLIGKYQMYLFLYGTAIFASLFDISWLFYGTERFGILSVRNFIIKIFSVILIFLFIKSVDDLWIYICIQSGSILVSNLFLWPAARKIVKRPQIGSVYNIVGRIRHSFSFFVPQIAISLYATLNKVMLGFISGPVAAGYFDSSDKIVRLIFTMFTALSTVMLPRISNMYAHGKFERIRVLISSVIKISTWLIIPIVFGIIINSNLIVKILLGPSYQSMNRVLVVSALMLLPMSVANVLGNQVLVPFNRIKWYTISVVCGAALNLLVDVPLILLDQATGAAWASLSSEVTVTLIQVYYCRDVLYKFINKNELREMIIGITFLCLSYLAMKSVSFSEIELLVVSIIVAGIYLITSRSVPINGIKKLRS